MTEENLDRAEAAIVLAAVADENIAPGSLSLLLITSGKNLSRSRINQFNPLLLLLCPFSQNYSLSCRGARIRRKIMRRQKGATGGTGGLLLFAEPGEQMAELRGSPEVQSNVKVQSC